MKAGFVCNDEDYIWSSCGSYLLGLTDDLVSRDEFFRSMNLSPDALFSSPESYDDIPEKPVHKKRLTDEQGLLVMQEICGFISHAQFQQLNKTDRNRYIRILYAKGLSVQQLVRICEISKFTVERILQMKK